MAANEDRTAMWRTPLSTPVRSNENGFQDLFRHSEKLLASAVSICRLKGSVECQTGGIITVCEEMQRLLRLAFNETARLEKELKKQKQTYDEDISFLKERISYLEDKKENPNTNKDIKTTKVHNNERLPLKPSTTENTREDAHSSQENTTIGKTPSTDLKVKSPISKLPNPTDCEKTTPEPGAPRTSSEQVVQSKAHVIDEELKIADSDDDLSLEVSVFDINKECKQKTTSRQTSNRKPHDSSKSKKTSAKKSTTTSSKPQSNNKNKETKATEKKAKETKSAETKAKETKATEKAKGRKSTESKAKKHSNSKIVDDDVEMFEEPKDAEFDANDSTSSDVFLNPESGLLEMKESFESEANEEDIEEEVFKCNSKKKEDPEQATSTNKNKKKEPKAKKATKKDPVKQKTIKNKTTEAIDIEIVPESPRSGLSSSPIKPTPIDKETEKQENASMLKTSPGVVPDEPEEVLGDMTFLIDISSMISSFVSNSDSKQLELPLMAARERADARKLASLFNLHISIGSKSDNRSSLILSKMANSQMPKPGKLDNLLSKLSIAAAKEAERLSSKTRNKRKFSTVGDSASFTEETNSQTKRSGMSRNKKAKI